MLALFEGGDHPGIMRFQLGHKVVYIDDYGGQSSLDIVLVSYEILESLVLTVLVNVIRPEGF